MTDRFIIASQIGLWLLVGGLYIAVFLLYRYLGNQLQRRTTSPDTLGPEVGSSPEQVVLVDHSEHQVFLGGPSTKARLVVFLRENCPACTSVRSVLRSMSAQYSGVTDTVIAYRGATEHMKAYAVDFPDDVLFLSDSEASSKWRIPGTPFVVALDRAGVVRKKGVALSGEQFGSYFESLRQAAQISGEIPGVGVPH